MTCKDCFHFEVCDSGRHIGEYIDDDGVYSEGVEQECKAYKNKSDFVEVVRCRNCKHGQYAYLNDQKIATGVTCEYDQDRIKPFNHFCGNGERRDR